MATIVFEDECVYEKQDLALYRHSTNQVLKNARFVGCSFYQARLSELETQNCEFDECNFLNASLYSSKHRNTSFLNCSFQGANLFGAEFDHCRMVGSVLDSADTNGIQVLEGDWSFCILRMKDLSKMNLQGVKLAGADLQRCNLTRTDLRDADLSRAILVNADLRKADLRGASLEGVNLKDVQLKGARMTIDQVIQFALSHGIVVE